MKKFCFFLSVFLTTFYASGQSHKTIGSAIAEAAAELSRGLPANSPVLIISVEAPTKALSDYLTNELSSAVIAGRSLTLVERSPELMRRIEGESTYQLSGYVSDEDAVSLGRQTGARIAIGGSVGRAGELYTLTIRAVEIENSEVRLFKTFLVKADALMDSMMAQNQSAARPQWLDFPLEYGKRKYENLGPAGNAVWYYDVGTSNRTATEQRARTRARENLQQTIAANIASNYSANIDIYELSLSADSDTEDVQRAVRTAITNSIKLRLPSFEVLEWHVEKGTENGSPWYIAHVLVRFPRQDIIKMIEQIDPAPIARAIARNLGATPGQPDFTDQLLEDLREARDSTMRDY